MTGCWLWTGAKSRGGYGHAQVAGRYVQTHRAAYEVLVGPIPAGLVLDHLCRTPACYNPAHLEPVTKVENARRGIKGVLTTHCPAGHEYNDENTNRAGWGDRVNTRKCRVCDRLRHRVATGCSWCGEAIDDGSHAECAR